MLVIPRLALLPPAALLFIATSAHAQDDDRGLSFAVGLGVGYEAEYEGSDEYEATILPFLEIGYDFGNSWRSSIGFDGGSLGFTIYENERLSFGLGIGYGGGRESADTAILAGLPDIDDGITVDAGFSYFVHEAISFDFGVTKYADGTEGLQGSLGVSTGLPVTERSFVEFGLSATWSDDDYAQGFYGVSATQAAASTTGLAQYTASSGVTSVDLSVDYGYEFTDRVTGVASLGVSKLTGDAEDSPFTKDDVNPSFGLGLVYEF